MVKGTILIRYPQELKNVKYSISREQHFFFEQSQYIEFDGLISAVERKKLFDVLKKHNAAARDLSHVSQPVKAVTHMTRLAKLASELTRVDHLRFGFDQLLCPPITLANVQEEVCISGLICLLFLPVDNEEGHGIFALPSAQIAELPLDLEKKYFLIAWAEERAQYILQPKDPHTHELKKHGYVFGDRLKTQWHPTLIR